MTKVQALIKLIKDNGGAASWQYIYDNIEKYYPAAKASKDWEAGLRGVLYREIKNNRSFKRIGFGVYALLDYQEENTTKEIQKDKVRVHSYIEGLLVELGNYEKFDTYCADPNATFKANVSIGQLTTVREFPEFTYPEIISVAKRIDVIWFNRKGYKFPRKVFEVVESIGTIGESLNRIYQLKEFQAELFVITQAKYQNKIINILKREPYFIYSNLFKVKSYDEIINYYQKRLELEKLKL